MPNPDLEIRGGGGGGDRSSRPSQKRGIPPQKIFSALQASVWSKNRGTWAPRSPPLDPPLQELFPVIQLLFSLTLSMLDSSLRQTMVAVLAACISDSWTKCIIACDHLEQATVVGS